MCDVGRSEAARGTSVRCPFYLKMTTLLVYAHAAATLASQAVIAAAQQKFGDANGLQQRNEKLAAANAKRQKTMAANGEQTPTRSTCGPLICGRMHARFYA